MGDSYIKVSSLKDEPDNLKFIDRIVAYRRTVAMNHTAGQSTPHQNQMALFSVFSLLDKSNPSKLLTTEICHRRMNLLYEGLGLPKKHLRIDADYYTEFDLEIWSNHHYGKEFTDYLQKNLNLLISYIV